MSYQITVRPAGHVFVVADDETILDAALRQGFAFPYGCRNGACGSCKGRVLAGSVNHGPQRPEGLSAAEEAEGMALFCQAVPLDDCEIEVREIGIAPNIVVKILPCRVARIRRLAADVVELALQLPANERLQFMAGQYLDILLKGGERRSYSLANAPHDDQYLLLHIKHVDGGHFSGQVFGAMKEKTLLRIEGPLGTFILDETSPRPRLFVGGGTGFAPLKAMLDHLLVQGLDRQHHLFWGARDAAGIYAGSWLAQAHAQAAGRLAITPVLSDSTALAIDGFPAETGWVHDAVIRQYPDLSGFDVYMAGPPPMIKVAIQAFTAAGLPSNQLYYDSFEPANTATAKPVSSADT